MLLSELYHFLECAGARPVHCHPLLRSWIRGLPLDAGTRRHKVENRLPLSLRGVLPQLEERLDQLAMVQAEVAGENGTRLLLRLADGQRVESVLLPRDGVCISTQVGCAVGCLFCMTGKSGLLRQLSSLEMVAQVVLARRKQRIRKVVFMGMGEPAHNLDAVLEAIDLLGSYGDIGHKNLVLSTVGDMRVFQRLPTLRVKPGLAISLHTTCDQLRRELLPRAPRIAVADLVEMGEQYARAVGYPVQYQWTLLKGINDTQEELEAILPLLRGKYAVLNLIPFNAHEGDHYERPDAARIIEIVHYLHSRGVLTKVRNSAGQDVDGGCGQLRARVASDIT
jgi:23S rRNA (adenine2503-C2)-methyltransferase